MASSLALGKAQGSLLGNLLGPCLALGTPLRKVREPDQGEAARCQTRRGASTPPDGKNQGVPWGGREAESPGLQWGVALHWGWTQGEDLCRRSL